MKEGRQKRLQHPDMSSCLNMLKVVWGTDENKVVVVGIFGVKIFFPF